MNVSDYLRKHDLSDEDVEALAAPYERGDFESGNGALYSGSHLDTVGKRRITVIYDARATQQVAAIAKMRGVTVSDVYRDALEFYPPPKPKPVIPGATFH